jgi:hypothetical protein
VILFVADVEAASVHWAWAKVPPDSSGIRVTQAQTLRPPALGLASQVIEWLEQRGMRAFRSGLPFFAEMWQRVLENVNYDSFMEAEPEKIALLEFCYRQARLIREAFGMTSDMFPWDVWVARSRVVYGDESLGMRYGTHDEAVEYIRPLVDELFEVGKALLNDEEETSENAAAKSWATAFSMTYAIETDFDRAPRAFWAYVDECLRRRGVLRSPAVGDNDVS